MGWRLPGALVWASSSTSAICGRRAITRVEVHLLEHLILVAEPLARQHFEPRQQRLGFGPAVSLDHADHDIGAGLDPRMRALQHLVGLADPGGGADEDFQLAGATFLPPGRFQQGFRRGTLFGIAADLDHTVI